MQRDLTDRFLKTLTPPESGLIEVSDTKRRGLRYRLSASGRGTFIYEKRIKGGKKRKVTLGTYPATGLSEARDMSLEIEAEAAKGIDRVEIEKAKRLADEAAKAKLVTVQKVIDTYHELHLSDLRTGDERKRQLVKALEPHLNTSITDLTRKDLQAAIDDKAKAGRVIMANRIKAALSAFSKWAYQRGYMDEDVGASLTKAGKEKPRERVLSLDEVRAIYQATFNLEYPWGPMFRLLLLTGQRRGEIISLEHSEIDFDKFRIVKPGAKTKNGKPHITHLSVPALAELRSIDRSESNLVFTTTGVTPVSGISKAKRYMDELLGDDFAHWRIHDIRTALATALAESGEPEHIVDRILNHSASGSAPSAVARVYNQADNLPQRARALDKWAEMITGTSKVVELHYG